MCHLTAIFGAVAWAATVACAAENSPSLPEPIPDEWLAPPHHPRLFVFPEDLDAARRVVHESDWGRTFLKQQHMQCDRFAKMSDQALRALVPGPNSQFVYGLGMNLDPVHGKRLTWAGWDDPFRVKSTDSTVYPNDLWPDDGSGAVDADTGQRYWFVARAHGFIMQQLEQRVLPALADVWALERSRAHARAAAVLLDAIAAVYPTNRRGPLDYPTARAHYDRGGRLDRPYYQVARGLINYGHTIDLVATSGEFATASSHGDFSVREHIIRNLLWDGGTFCLQWAKEGYQLHNGHADYMQGASVTGVLLGVRNFCDVMIEGPLSLPAMLDINIDRNGFYYETSPAYADHARKLYVHLAELLVAMRRLGWSGIPSPYDHPSMKLLLDEPFNRQEVGGHLPMIGDSGPDDWVHSPLRRRPVGKRRYTDSFLLSQIDSAWIRLVRSDDPGHAAQLLANSFADTGAVQPSSGRWSVYHVGPSLLARVEAVPPAAGGFETNSTFYGAKGLALLRGGRSEQRYGAQLLFGPIHNHGQREALTWTFFARGAEWSYDPGYSNKHYRMGWTTQSVSHQAVVVNGTSHDGSRGSGHLLAWLAEPNVQWTFASHPQTYAEQDVSRFERLIAQVHNPKTGELGYWLDVSLVDGGDQRDDSFHTRMKQVDLDIDLQPTGQPSMYGNRDLGRMVEPSLYLRGEEKRGFYWSAPGDGYGFLGSPRTADMPECVRILLTEPWRYDQPAVIIADLLGATGRKIIVADGATVGSLPQVPYIIQRDSGRGASVFTKLIRLADHVDDDPVASFTKIGDRQFVVTWDDGREDRWRVDGLPLPAVSVTRFDTEGKRYAVLRSGPQCLTGKVVAVSAAGAPAELTISWDEPMRPAASSALVTQPPLGSSATWRVEGTHGDRVRLQDATLALARTDLTPVDDQPGWYESASGISRFMTAANRPNQYAVGKAVYHGDLLVGRIAELSNDARRIRLVGPRSKAYRQAFAARILEVGEGDRVTVTVNTVTRL
ncbi:MAG: hypothetical protein ACC645_11740 [Pirellulales bacterium]